MNAPSRSSRRLRRGQAIRRSLFRRLFWLEHLEPRTLLASDWTNVLQPLNTTGDEFQNVSPLDVLVVINEINGPTIRDNPNSPLPPAGANGKKPPPFVDVDCDNFVTPLDVLRVINAINSERIPLGWQFSQTGGGNGGQGSVGAESCSPRLREGNSLITSLTTNFIVPQNASAIVFEYTALNFDTSSQGLMRDVFEAALLDSGDRPLVPPIGAGRDVYFNTAEGVGEVFTLQTVVANGQVSLSLADVLPGTQAKLVLRLVNNDSDTQTSVVVRSVRFESVQPGAPLGTLVGPETPVANAGGKYVPPFPETQPPMASPALPDPAAVPGRPTSTLVPPPALLPPIPPLPAGTNSNVDSRGTEFWVGFPDNLYEGSNVPQKFLFLTGESATTGVVQIPGLIDPATSQPFRVGFAVNPGTVTTIELPSLDVGDNVDSQTDYDIEAEAISRIERKGVHVTSDLPITVYGLNRAISTSDAFLALPVTALGKDYLNISYQNTNASITSTNGTQLLVVATEDDTNVSIVPGPYSPLLQDAQATLRRPSGSIPLGFQTTDGSDLKLFTTDEAGEYRWNATPAIDGYAGRYVGNVVDLQSTAVSIVIGERIDALFPTGGEVRVYSFNVQAGQRLYFDALESQFPVRPVLRIVSPTGLVQVPTGDNDSFVNNFGALRFNETGTYYMVLSGDRSTSFQYAFRWLDFAQAINPGYGTTIETDHSIGETKLYRFDGLAGQKWFYDAQDSHRSTVFTVYGPGGTRLVAASSADDDFITLPVDGAYYVLQQAGGFQLPSRFRIDDLSSSPLLANQQAFVTSYQQGRATTYRFQAQGGDSLRLDALQNQGRTTLEVRDPAGNRVSLSGNLIFPPNALTANLSMSGMYTLVVQGVGYQDVGESELRLSLNSAATVTPSGFNTSQTLTVPVGGAGSYSFTGRAGTAVIIDSLDSASENLFAEIIAPDGTRLATAQESQDFFNGAPFFLPQSGAYTIAARGNSGTATGTYVFRVLDLVSFATPIQLNTEVQASLTTGREIQVYSFSTSSGATIGFDGRAEVTIPVNVYDAELRPLLSTNTASDRSGQSLSSGTKFVVAFGQTGVPANYSFELESLSSAPTITLGTEVSGSLSPGRSTATYQVNLAAGQPIRIDSLDSDSDQVQIVIFNAGGRVLYNNTSNLDSGPPAVPLVVVNEAGTYFVVVQGNQAANADYRFRIDDLLAAPVLGFDTDQTISMEGLAAKVFRFEAQAGELIRIDRIDASVQNAIWQVVSGSNQVLGNDDNARSFTARVLRSGTHYLAISGSQNAGALQFQFKASRQAATPTPLSGVNAPFTLEPGMYETLSHTFTAPVGRFLYLDVIQSQFGIPEQTITIDRGETYLVRNARGASFGVVPDLTGTTVSSDKPIAVFGGNRATFVPDGFFAADHLVEQLPPTRAWGTRFITIPFETGSTRGDLVRMVARDDDTQIRIDGVLVATIKRGEYLERVLVNATEITATRPILLAQYAQSQAFYQNGTGGNPGFRGDPFMIVVAPYEQYLNSYVVTTPAENAIPQASHFDRNYLNLTISSDAIGSIALNGTLISSSLFEPIGTSGFSGATIPIPLGSHSLESPFPFGVMVYGFATFDSYGYAGGQSLSPIANVASVAISPEQTSRVIQLPQVFRATLRDSSGLPVRDVRVDWDVAGVNSQRSFSYSDSNGIAEFTCIGSVAGRDIVTARVGDRFSDSIIDWEAEAALPTLDLFHPTAGTSIAAGTTLIATGRIFVDRPRAGLDVLMVNDRLVDRIDTSGQFFVPIFIGPGENAFDFVLQDTLGRQATQRIVLKGEQQEPGKVDFRRFSDVSGSFHVVYSRSSYRQEQNTVIADIAVRNAGQYPASVPILVGITNLSDPEIQVRNHDGVTPDGIPYYDFSKATPAGELDTGDLTSILAASFYAPKAAQFTYDLVFFAKLNEPPQIRSLPSLNAYPGREFRYTVEGSDPDSETLRYELLQAPDGMTIDAVTGTLTWLPKAANLGNHVIEIRVSDQRTGVATQSFVLTVREAPPNRPPVITSEPPNLAYTESDLVYDFQAADPDRDILQYRILEAPAGTSIDSSTGRLRWRPTANEIGDRTLRLEAVDDKGQRAIQSYTVRVVMSPANFAPTFSTTPVERAVANRNYFYVARVMDFNNDPQTFQLVEAPTGLTIQTSGLAATLSWTPGPSDVGTHPIKLLVNDGRGGQSLQQFNLLVGISAVPVITSSPVTTASVGTPYQYNVVASDTDNDPIHYSIVRGPIGMSIDSMTGRLSWTPDSSTRPSEEVTIAATDSWGLQATQSFAIQVAGGGVSSRNTDPFIRNRPDLILFAERTWMHRIDAVDREEGSLQYDLVRSPEGMTIDTNRGVVAWTPRFDQVGTHTIVLRVQDGKGGIALATHDLEVRSTASVPIITSSPPKSARINTPWEYGLRAQSAEDPELFFSLVQAPSGMTIQQDPPDQNPQTPSRARIVWTPVQLGTFDVAWSVRDSQGNSQSQSFSLEVLGVAPNVSPEFTSNPRLEAPMGQMWVYRVQTFDEDSNPTTLRSLQLPIGAEFDALNRIVRWTPTSTQIGLNRLSMEANDGNGGITLQTFDVSVSDVPVNNAPIIVSSPPAYFTTVGEIYAYDLVARDPDNDPVVWSLDEGAEGMSIDPADGSLLWDPGMQHIGAHRIVVRVSDPSGREAQQSFTLIAASINYPPTINSEPIVDANVDEPYVYGVRGIDPEGKPVEYRLLSGPSGMVIDSMRGILRWTPTLAQIGPHSVRVEARDPHFDNAVQEFVIVVSDRLRDLAPVFQSRPTFRAIVDIEYRYAALATDPEGTAVDYSLLQGPSGMAVDPASGMLRWTPRANQAGPHIVRLLATDANGNPSEQRFAVLARINTAPEITSSPATRVSVGDQYRYDVRALDPDQDGVTFTLISGPQGMSIDDRGRVQWTAPQQISGPFSVTIQATDTYGSADTQQYLLEITPDNVPPRIELQLSNERLAVGSPGTALVRATDNIGVAFLRLTIDGQSIPIADDGTAVIPALPPGTYIVSASAEDLAENTDVTSVQLVVYNPLDSSGPEIAITSPATRTITAPTPIRGSITDGQLDWYRVEWARADQVDINDPEASDPDYRLLASGKTNVNDQVLATFDPTLLTNDDYVVRIQARDLSGNTTTRVLPLAVEGNLKFGQFTFELTDLVVPLAGIPIHIQRRYDTLSANDQGDFGYGWSMNIREGAIRESIPVTELEAQGLPFAATPFQDGTRVYVTGPDGQRRGFTFRPIREFSLFGGGSYLPRFVPDAGVNDKLDVGSVPLRKVGTSYYSGFFGEPFNPSAYRLTLQNGTIYEYGQFGGLDNIQSPNGIRLDFRPDGIFSSTGVSIRFVRDGQGRIVQIVDPAGNSLRYAYNIDGELASVTDAEGLTTRYVYRRTPAHFLSHAVDPQGQLVFQATYDSNGRLLTTTNAAGATVRNQYDLGNLQETIRDPLGVSSTIEFDHRGNPIEVTRPNGSIRLAYDANDNVIEAIDEAGNKVTRTLDETGNPTRIKDPLGAEYHSRFDENGRLLGVENPAGHESIFIYDSKGNLVEFVNAMGISSTADYDALGRVVRYTDANGNVTTYEYGKGPRPIRMATTAPSGTQPQGAPPAGGGSSMAASTKRFEYNALGQIVRSIDGNGNATVYAYDKLGRPISETSPLGNVTRFEYEGEHLTATVDPLGRKTRYRYDAVGRRNQVVMPDGGVYQATFDSNNQLTRFVDPLGRSIAFAYRTDGRLESETDALGKVTRYEYDVVGNRTAIIDGLMARWEYDYDAVGRIIRSQDALGAVNETTYDLAGNIAMTRDTRGGQTSHFYDAVGRKTRSTDPLGNSTQWEYDPNGNMIRSVDANGHATEFEYDSLNRIIVHRAPNGGVKRQEFDAAGNRIRFVNELGSIYQYVYDADNRGIQFVNPEGDRATRKHDAAGNVIAFTDEAGNAVSYVYDIMNRQSGIVNGAGKATRFTYDLIGNLTTVTDTLGNRTSYEYDARDSLVRITDPLGKSASYQYDAVGNRIAETDRNGRRIEFIRDANGRIIQEKWLDGTTVSASTSIVYDPEGNVTRVDDGNYRLNFVYDANNRLISQSQTGIDGLTSLTISQTLDPVGNVISITDNAGARIQRTVNSLRSSESVQWSGAGIEPLRIDSQYNLRGDPVSQTRYRDLNGAQRSGVSQWEYDPSGRLRRIAHLADTAGQLTMIDERKYSFDELYRVIGETSLEDVTEYTYDSANQLIAADHTSRPDENYTYDRNGNRTSGGGQVALNNKISRDARFTYAYDSEGNLSSRTDRVSNATTIYRYDHRNRLTSVIERSSNGTVLHQSEYAYDPLDRRTSLTTDGTQTSTAYVGLAPWADYDANGNAISRYLPGDEVDGLLARYRTGQGSAWYLSDQLGSVTKLMSPQGAVLNSTTYDSFGNILQETNPQLGDRFKFTGREWDATTGLYHYRARNYDPLQGRFLSEDPLGFTAGDTNLNRYVNNNPVNFTDPSGLQAIADGGGLYTFVSVYASFALTWGADTPFTYRLACQEGMCGISGNAPEPSVSVSNLTYGPILDMLDGDSSFAPAGASGLILKGARFMAKHFNGGFGVNSEGQFCVNYGLSYAGFNAAANQCGNNASVNFALDGPPGPGLSSETAEIPEFPSMGGDFDFFVITTATSPHLVISANLAIYVSVGTELSLIAAAASADDWVESVEVDYEKKTDNPKAAVKSRGIANLNPRFPNESDDSTTDPPYPHHDHEETDDPDDEENEDDEEDEEEEEDEDDEEDEEGDTHGCDEIAIGDWVWYDTNEDGIQNESGTGVEDVSVELWSPGTDLKIGGNDDVRLATTVTDAHGFYLFEELSPGPYFVRFVLDTLPPGFKPTLRNATDDGFDSDADEFGFDEVIDVVECYVESRRDMGIIPS